uniref:Uncharacterized protein n=1 Tax=Oryza rufipogon TaxID=4529 RepID=A0A0E0RGI0_ORYRU
MAGSLLKAFSFGKGLGVLGRSTAPVSWGPWAGPRQWRLRRSPSTTDNDNATPLPPQEPPLPIRTHATVPPAPKGTGHPSPPLPHP